MQIQAVIQVLEAIAPPRLQESYDNAGLLAGNRNWECKGIITCLDITEEIVTEAVQKKCNLIVAHHPLIFKGLKKITGTNTVENILISAIKNDIAIYAIHTNLDNVIDGVNGRIADKLGLINRSVLSPKDSVLEKLSVFVPENNKSALLEALFAAGAGDIGNYSECSFSTSGMGSFNGNADSQPYIGKPGERHYEKEDKVEVIFPFWLRDKILQAMRSAHPYEEVAYYMYVLQNTYSKIGSGLYGKLEEAMDEQTFLALLKQQFNLSVIKHTRLRGKPIQHVALCGGAGSFLTSAAIASGADIYITGDVKYHEFFDAAEHIILADIGHYESEQFTIDLLFDILTKNFPNFAVLKTGIMSNPVNYYY